MCGWSLGSGCVGLGTFVGLVAAVKEKTGFEVVDVEVEAVEPGAAVVVAVLLVGCGTVGEPGEQ